MHDSENVCVGCVCVRMSVFFSDIYNYMYVVVMCIA